MVQGFDSRDEERLFRRHRVSQMGTGHNRYYEFPDFMAQNLKSLAPPSISSEGKHRR